MVGTSKAALHYHFPTKADLGRALIERYTERFFRALDEIEASGALGGTSAARKASCSTAIATCSPDAVTPR